MGAVLQFPRADTKGLLCARLTRAADLYEQRAATKPETQAMFLRSCAEDCRHYQAQIESGDPLAFALLKHFAMGSCEWIEARTQGEAA